MGRKCYSSHRFSAFAAVCQPRRRRRNEKNGRNFTCSSPWSIISCWFSLRRTKGEKNVNFWHYEEEDDAKYIESIECMHGGSSSSQDGAGDGKEASFNLGVGFGIMYLMAASKYEFNKMVELCKQMETLVQDFKIQLQNQQKQIVFTPPESNVTITIPIKAPQDNVSLQEHPHSLQTENSDTASSSEMIAKDTKMHQLEAELEVELEHLQVQLDSEVLINCEHTEIVVEDSAPEESITTLSFEQAFEPSEEIISMENYGVCPRELERRLHELLAMRQEERIKALESALECSMQKLHENERELLWWKDTARIVFQKIPWNCFPVSQI